ncbi:hypothetical protein BDQ17DRAFT_646856 [Cyathus striatus]|nr:hypothetical protein BDQ17DRAFT_646856 [Cyathus striatus]
MDPIMIKYCAQDVTILFDLMKELKRKIGGAYRTKDWDQRIKTASSDRTSLAKGTVCQGGVKKDRNRAIAPLI